MRTPLLILALLAGAPFARAYAQPAPPVVPANPPAAAPAASAPAQPAPATHTPPATDPAAAQGLDPGSSPGGPVELAPFTATYDAYNKGKLAGVATMQLTARGGPQWTIDLAIKGNRGFAGIVGLNLQQATVFDVIGDQFRPISQSTVRKALFVGRKVVGIYDWDTHVAQWTGDLKPERRLPVPLKDGDQSALLINLSIIRDAAPGKTLNYRFVDLGRVRDHVYQVAAEPETVVVDDLSYSAMRVSRAQSGSNETILWVATGVPTPIRILQRSDGQDGIDLRLTQYQGTP